MLHMASFVNTIIFMGGTNTHHTTHHTHTHTHTIVQEKYNSFQYESNMVTVSYNGQCSCYVTCYNVHVT